MCSIAGGTKNEVVWMLHQMKHRAPDEEGVLSIAQDFWIGMGRLAIVDTQAKNVCPYRFAEFLLTFNGEIYNYEEIRKDLEKRGYTFETKTDSEGLLKAYAEYGEACLERFNGMFALAISDGKTVFLARDSAGEKPLYYTEEPFRFASEAKALNLTCKELPPAHSARYHFTTKTLTVQKWWKPKKIEISGDPIGQLDALLEKAVTIRVPREVPVALYYSGGIDSVLINSYHEFKEKITYTDGNYADEFKEVFPKILWHLDYPVSSFSAFGLWKLAEEAKKKRFKVVISGEGADELFGGYVRYLPNEFNRIARKLYPSYAQMFPYRDMMAEEFNGNLKELLRMGDRMSSAFGLENRCPFLDKNIIEFAHSLPIEWKTKGHETKVILRRLIERRVSDYWHIEKAGLFCSVNRWIGEEHPFTKGKYLRYQEALWKKQ